MPVDIKTILQSSLPPGPQGYQGTSGSLGSQGNQGNQGAAGSAGTQGHQGVQGTAGSAGAQGNQGNQGATGSGTQGNQGNQGASGSASITGSNTQILFNYNNGIQGSPNLTYNVTTNIISANAILEFSTAFVNGQVGEVSPGLIGISTTTSDLYLTTRDDMWLYMTSAYTELVANASSLIVDSSGGFSIYGINPVNYNTASISAETSSVGSFVLTSHKYFRFAANGETQNWYMQANGLFETPASIRIANAYVLPKTAGNVGEVIVMGSGGQANFQSVTGTQGNQGYQGNQGSTGSQGNQGNQGNQGSAGTQGNQGNQGTAGSSGTQGNQGSTGAQGNQGSAGAQGNQGNDGAQGNQGYQGSSSSITGSNTEILFNYNNGIQGSSNLTYNVDTNTMQSNGYIYIPNEDTYLGKYPGGGYVGVTSNSVPVYLTPTYTTDLTYIYITPSSIEMYVDGNSSLDISTNDVYISAVDGISSNLCDIYLNAADGTTQFSAMSYFRFASLTSGSLWYMRANGQFESPSILVNGQLQSQTIRVNDAYDLPITAGNEGQAIVMGAGGTTSFQDVTGVQGNQGNQGSAGAQGNQGNDGAQGNQGYQGDVGAQGNQGNQGYQGVAETTYTFTFGGTGTPTTGTDLTPHLWVHTDMTANAMYVVTKTAPSGGVFAVEIQKSADGTSWSSVGTVSVSDGNKTANSLITTALSTNDRLRFDITDVNGASDWTCTLVAKS